MKPLFVFLFLLPMIRAQGQDSRMCAYTWDEEEVARSSNVLDDGHQVYIRVVVHVLYSSDEQNISNEQINAQIKILNDDFNRRNADSVNTLDVFHPVAGRAKIHFILTSESPGHEPSMGVTRTRTTHGPFFNDDVYYTARGGVDAWPTDLFLNIWIAELPEGTFGAAAAPGGNVAIDGVVIDHNYFGTETTVSPPYDKGRTVTHEVGHWLGLKHLWGNEGGCTGDDGISDTPRQTGPSTGCDINRMSCGGLNMVQNFMDHSSDVCMNVFTKGQASEMRRVLFTYRQNVTIENIVTGVEESESYELKKIGYQAYHIVSPKSIQCINIYNVIGREITAEIFYITDHEILIHIPCQNELVIILIKSSIGFKVWKTYAG